MPNLTNIEYEFSDYDEASAAIEAWDRVKPGNIHGVPYPKFEIDWIDLKQHDTIVIWLKLKKDE